MLNENITLSPTSTEDILITTIIKPTNYDVDGTSGLTADAAMGNIA